MIFFRTSISMLFSALVFLLLISLSIISKAYFHISAIDSKIDKEFRANTPDELCQSWGQAYAEKWSSREITNINFSGSYCTLHRSGFGLVNAHFYEYPDDNVDCSIAKPVNSDTQTETACYDSCQYEYITTIKDHNALISTHEYIPTGSECTGSETALTNTTLYDTPISNKNCRLQNGVNVCYEKETDCTFLNDLQVCGADKEKYNCGLFNNEPLCFNTEAEQKCTFLNGDAVCVDEYYTIIPSSSPDNPANGGNGDGNPYNDPFTSDEIANGSEHYDEFKKEAKKELAKQNALDELQNKNDKNQSNDFTIKDEFKNANIDMALSNYYDALNNAPIVQVLNINPVINDDTCPVMEFNNLGYIDDQSTTVHCQIVEENSAALEILFKALWIITGLFIVFMG